MRIAQNSQNFFDQHQCALSLMNSLFVAPAVPEKDLIAGLTKGLRLIEAFDDMHTRLTSSEAASRVGISPAAARRCLLTLCQNGYAQTDGKRYWLDHGILRLSYAYSVSTRLPRLLQSTLDALSERTRESASVVVLHGAQVMVAARSTARKSLTVGLGVGSRLPLHCSATGRILLSSLPTAEFEAVFSAMHLNKLTPHTLTDPIRLRKLLKTCIVNGYALSNQEIELGVRSIAVPLYNMGGLVVGALSLSSRADRMTSGEMIEQLLPAMRRCQSWVRTRLS
ncbi:MAG: helix-turn-helix domain-containing protein [Gammaproteobacteria bacterium]|nr:helix-turn-helix domain-containing protein [Gammaproteobacteria bacterium]